MARTIKMFKLPDRPLLPLTPLTEEDIPGALELINGYLARFS